MHDSRARAPARVRMRSRRGGQRRLAPLLMVRRPFEAKQRDRARSRKNARSASSSARPGVACGRVRVPALPRSRGSVCGGVAHRPETLKAPWSAALPSDPRRWGEPPGADADNLRAYTTASCEVLLGRAEAFDEGPPHQRRLHTLHPGVLGPAHDRPLQRCGRGSAGATVLLLRSMSKLGSAFAFHVSSSPSIWAFGCTTIRDFRTDGSIKQI